MAGIITLHGNRNHNETCLVTDCYFAGAPDDRRSAISVVDHPGAPWVEIDRAFIAPVAYALELRAPALFSYTGGLWKRFWRAIARFALRRAS